MKDKLPAINVTRKVGSESLRIGSSETTHSIVDFWRWSNSDLLGNALRGKFAEFIVACALGLEDGVRTEWDAFDLQTPNGLKIEVKSAAYLQSWPQQRLSSIKFDVRTTHGWDATTNTSSKTQYRQSDVYVFCLLHHQDKSSVDPLDLSQWTFNVISTRRLNESLLTQKTLSLVTLLKLQPRTCGFTDLRNMINIEAAIDTEVK